MDEARRVLFNVLLRRRVGREDFPTWFGGMEIHEASDRLVLVMPSKFHITWIDQHYRDDVRTAAQTAWPEVTRVCYVMRRLSRDERGLPTYAPDLDDVIAQH